MTWAYLGFADFNSDVPRILHFRTITPEVVQYLQFVLREGQPILEAQGFGRLPRPLLERALGHLASVVHHGLAAIRSRTPAASAWVQRITIRWYSDEAPNLRRSHADADVLVQKLLARARAGADFGTLRAEVPDDTALAYRTGDEVSSAGRYNSFRALATSLQIGEVGIVRSSETSWALVKRVPPRRPGHSTRRPSTPRSRGTVRP